MTISHTKRSWLWAALTAFLIGLPGASGTPVYQIREITAPGAVGITPLAINRNGTIVGSVVTEDGTMSATFWRGDSVAGLNRTDGVGSVGYAINSAGSVAGGMYTPDGEFQAYLWTNGSAINLASRPSVATGISNSGDVTGWMIGDDGQQQAFLWRRGTMQTITNRPAAALAINAQGQVVGYTLEPDGARAFLWEKPRGRKAAASDGLTSLGTLPGGTVSQALAINNSGQVVGWSNTALGQVRAFLYENGQMVELPGLGGSFSQANAITDKGTIVGSANAADGTPRAVLWSGGQIVDLNTYLPAGSDWVLQGAVAVNESGIIVGYGTYQGEPRSFVLSPR